MAAQRLPVLPAPLPNGCSERFASHLRLETPMGDSLYQITGRHRVEPLPERKPSWLKVRAQAARNTCGSSR